MPAWSHAHIGPVRPNPVKTSSAIKSVPGPLGFLPHARSGARRIHSHSGRTLDERFDDHASDPIGVLAKQHNQPIEDRLPLMADRVRRTLYVE